MNLQLLDCYCAFFKTCLQSRAHGSILYSIQHTRYHFDNFVEILSSLQPTNNLPNEKIQEWMATSLKNLVAVKTSFSIDLPLMSSKKLIGLISSIAGRFQMLDDTELRENLFALISGTTSDIPGKNSFAFSLRH